MEVKSIEYQSNTKIKAFENSTGITKGKLYPLIAIALNFKGEQEVIFFDDDYCMRHRLLICYELIKEAK